MKPETGTLAKPHESLVHATITVREGDACADYGVLDLILAALLSSLSSVLGFLRMGRLFPVHPGPEKGNPGDCLRVSFFLLVFASFRTVREEGRAKMRKVDVDGVLHARG